MLDEAQSSTLQMQRSKGRAFVSVSHRAGRTRLARLQQSGCAKAFLPKVHSEIPEIVFLNTSGGVTGGDHVEFELMLEANCKVMATTQTAERAYASSGQAGFLNIKATVGEGAHLDWLPQETILFENSHLRRVSEIELRENASVLMCETLVLGRAAMGEKLRSVNLLDPRRITRNGRPVYIDPVRLTNAVVEAPMSAPTLAGNRTFATIVFVGADAEDKLPALRRLLDHDGCQAAASAWDGKCVVRLLAPENWPMGQALRRILEHLRGDKLPRVWQN